MQQVLLEFHPNLLHIFFPGSWRSFWTLILSSNMLFSPPCCGPTIIWWAFAEFLWKSRASAIQVLGVGQKWSSLLSKLHMCPHISFSFRNPWISLISDSSWSAKLQRHLLEHQNDPCGDTEKNPSCLQQVHTESTDRQITLSLTLFVSQVGTRVICYIFHQM